MTDQLPTHSLVVIGSTSVWPTVYALNNALGYNPGSGVPLSTTGTAPQTHAGLHTWATDDYADICLGRTVPDIPGVDETQFRAFLAQLVISVDPVVGGVALVRRAHFNHVLAESGLQLIQGAE